MRSAFVAAAFAAGALAVPLMERDVVYETDIVYATAYVTVTEGDVAPTVAPVATTTSVKQNNNKHYGHRKPKKSTSVKSPEENEAGGYTSYYSWASTWTESAPAATSQAEQQQPQAYASQEEAAPAPTSEAPQSYDEPKPTSYAAEPSSAPAPASSASDAKPSDYISRALHHHNIHRANHSAPAVTWSDELAETALNIAKSCRYEHDTETGPSSKYGQNIAAGVKADNISAVITELFYNGEVALYGNQYGQDNIDDSAFHEWGHFTQIVWKNTTEIGCATYDCTDQGLANTGGTVPPYFTVCNYKEAGNMQMPGWYAGNVLAPRGDTTCYWNDSE